MDGAAASRIAGQAPAQAGEGWLARRRRAFAVVAPPAFLLVVPATAIGVKLLAAIREDAFAFDFTAYWLAGRAFLQGASPYAPVTPEALAEHVAFVYPPAAAAFFAPFALLPKPIAAVVFTVVVAGALVAALRIVGVSDWRWYGAAFLWPSVAYGIQSANLTLLLALGVALAWRYRSRTLVVGVAIGVLLALKAFLWPLLIWLVATRRYRAAAASVATAVATTSLAWAVISFADLRMYPEIVRQLEQFWARDAYTPFAVAAGMGLDPLLARGLGYGLAGVVLVSAFVVGRRFEDEQAAFLLAISGALLANPLNWIHSFALLLVPFAVLRPRFTWVLALPLLLVTAPARAPTPLLGLLQLTLLAGLVAYMWTRRVRSPAVAVPAPAGSMRSIS